MSKNNNIKPDKNRGQRTMSLLRSNSSISQNLAMTAKGATLASIYQAKKSGNEDTKVEVLKQQFQSRLEQKIIKEPQQTTTKLLNRYVLTYVLTSYIDKRQLLFFFGNCKKICHEKNDDSVKNTHVGKIYSE